MKLVKTDLYLLLIDEQAEIKDDDYLFDELTSYYAGIHQHSGVEYKSGNKPNIIQCKSGTTSPISYSSKVIAYYPLTKEAKELDLPLLPPFGEVDVEKLALKTYHIDSMETLDLPPFENTKNSVEGFIEGYKAAQSKGQYSLENILKFRKVLEEGALTNMSCASAIVEFDRFIQSLSTQQLPKEFIPTLKGCMAAMDTNICDNCDNSCKELKTITNLEGKKELVGKYLY